MTLVLIIVVVVSGALILGALWGLYGPLPGWLEGFLIALAGGALLISVVSELVEPAIEQGGLLIACLSIAAGAAVFSGIDYLIDEKWGAEKGGGLLAAITLDGVPENLALGVALIGAGGLEVAALAGSILLSNLPEAAGGAREMRDSGMAKWRILVLWGATALLLSIAAIGGNLLLAGAPEEMLAIIRCFAAGAVIASLATEVFPQAFRKDAHWAGIATAVGVISAISLGSLGS